MKLKSILFVLLLVLMASLVSAGTLRVTEEHPFLINGEWIPAKELKIGDRLTEINGKIVEIISIRKVTPKEPFLVYNLEAGIYNNFVVRDTDNLSIVVHNSNKINMFDRNLLRWIASSLKSKGVSKGIRSVVLSKLRNFEGRPLPEYEGFILDEILQENIVAFNRLREVMVQNSPDYVFALEKGGVFVGEVLTKNTPLANRLVRVSKAPHPLGIEKGRFDPEPFIVMIQQKIDSGAKKIAITDSYMGGRFARELRDNILIPLIRKNPDIQFETYFIRETFGFEYFSAGGLVLESIRGTIKPTFPYSTNVKNYISSTTLVLGDDMNIIYKFSKRPITIFDSAGNIEKIYNPEQSTRELLIDLLTGQRK